MIMTKTISKILFGLMLPFMVSLGTGARAEVNIDITQGNVEALPIAVTDFFGSEQDANDIGRQITDVITANFQRSGIFAPIDKKAFIQNAASMKVRPRFSDWRVIKAQGLVNGSVKFSDNGQIRVEFRLWDVFAEQQMLGNAIMTERSNWRRVAHIISDRIYKRLTGEDGYFDTRIVYIAESGAKTARIKRLAIMDQDGANHRYLTDGRTLVLTPRFSPRRQEITFLSYYNNTPRVYLFNIQTGRQELLGAFPGMTFAPRFSPDGNSVLMSHAENGTTDIYSMDLRTRKPVRLTNDGSINTSPSASPDGKRMAFNSDRGGRPQLYVMDIDGKNVKRISFGKGSYATPVWSPRGDLIAFTKATGGKFHIGVMRPDGSGERLLTESFLDEAPTWSPNGRVLMFFRQEAGAKGKTRIFSVDLTGYNLREVVTPGDASDPAWSPLNP